MARSPLWRQVYSVARTVMEDSGCVLLVRHHHRCLRALFEHHCARRAPSPSLTVLPYAP
jgi:hypothetical protein